jgi:hypothetical protein
MSGGDGEIESRRVQGVEYSRVLGVKLRGAKAQRLEAKGVRKNLKS